ncbi:MAG: transcriptional repressor [Rhodospirillales bacterium]|nr:MAG: transcriptional repressor [Rhodospirillales bacterium]
MPASPAPSITERLRAVGLRPTRQRLALGALLFSAGHDRHVTAERLHDEAVARGVKVSLATVYNTLNQLSGAGLLREVVVGPGRIYFDTNTGAHHHFFVEDDGALVDIPADRVVIARMPPAPPGMTVERVDVVVRVRR